MPLDGKNYQPCENARILREAAKIMREHGHARGVLKDKETGGVCLRGAIISTLVGYDNPKLCPGWALFLDRAIRSELDTGKFEKIDTVLKEYLEEQNIIPKGSLHGHVDWNNNPTTTKEEVIAALEGAAIFAEEKVTT